MIYCLYRFVWDNYKTYTTAKFISNEEDLRLLNAMIRFTNNQATDMGKDVKIPEVAGIDEFNSMRETDKDIINYTVRTILEDKPVYVNFFKERGDI